MTTENSALNRPIGDGGAHGGHPCSDIHRITKIGVDRPYRYRCIDCGHYFKIKPSSIDLDAHPAGAALIWESDHKLAARVKGDKG